ncbi:MAG: 1,6-anhydro-N-acetylmuramyl-L-alanine amidase AmpD [Burkholderiaceae bacterium]|nr:1,6-anhydro-N-acetylmuramyl-L-alanine amidase AmpD [Burkholderiaceae bacterium]
MDSFAIDTSGWVAQALRLPSPNHDSRPEAERIELLVIHNISLPPGEFGTGHIERLFTNRLDHEAHSYFGTLKDLRVSAHFLIARGGQLTQFVSCADRAWHAGESVFEGRSRCNDFSLGIELEGTDSLAYTDAQYEVLAPLARALFTAYPLRAVRGHSDVSAPRKTDPGAAFDWPRFARALGVGPSAFVPGVLP